MSSIGSVIFFIVLAMVIKSILQAIGAAKAGQSQHPEAPDNTPPAPTSLEEVLQRELQRQLDKQRQQDSKPQRAEPGPSRAGFPPQPDTLEPLEQWPPRRVAVPSPTRQPVPQVRPTVAASAQVAVPQPPPRPMGSAVERPKRQPGAPVHVIPGVERKRKRIQLKPRTVRQAVVLSEVIAPPLALRQPQGQSPW